MFGIGKKKVTLSEIDFDYVSKLTDADEAKQAVDLLKDEPYPQLLLAAKDRLRELDPKA